MLLAVHIHLLSSPHRLTGPGVQSYFARGIRVTVLILGFTDMAKRVDMRAGVARHGYRFGSSGGRS